MRARTLPKAEWARLSHTHAAVPWEQLDPESTSVIVVETDEGNIVGCHTLTYLLHAEFLWIHPDYRKRPSVARRLWDAVRVTVKRCGARGFITAAVDDEVRELIAHVGGKQLPGEHYLVEVK